MITVRAVQDKQHWRRWAASLSPPDRGECEAVVDHLTALLNGMEPTGILTYLSMPGEIPAERVVSRCPGHRYATTRTPPGGWLTVHRLDSERERHRFGYEQPVAGAPEFPLEAVGAVLVPGRVFGTDGSRIGWGAGYYDQLLGRLPGARAVGVTLERRIVDRLPSERHDVAMQLLVTEERIIEVPARDR